MTTVISGSSPSITFSDATTQTTAFTSTPSVTSITTSADSTINGVTVGKGLGYSNSNTAVGVSALSSSTADTNSTAVGYFALKLNTSGTENTAFGGYALSSNVTGADNSAFGRRALSGNTGSFNTGTGAYALYSNTSASNNTAVGYQAGYSVVSGSGNTFIGYQSGYLAAPTGTSLNVAVGYQSGYNLTGNANTLLGNGSGSQISSGANNTITGSYNGNQGGLDIRTLSNICVISDGDGNPQISTYRTDNNTAWANFDITQGIAGGGATNAYTVSAGTAANVFNGAFSGMALINDISTTGETCLVLLGGGAAVIVSQTATNFVNNSSPTGSQTGVYLVGTQLKIKPAQNTYYRIFTIRTRTNQ